MVTQCKLINVLCAALTVSVQWAFPVPHMIIDLHYNYVLVSFCFH